MSEYQKEQLKDIVDDIYEIFSEEVARARDKKSEEIKEIMESGFITMEEYKDAGLYTDLKYKLVSYFKIKLLFNYLSVKM